MPRVSRAATVAPPAPADVRIGVLALQGDFAEHLVALRALGVDAIEVRTLDQLCAVNGLIIPGGESTTIARLLIAFDLLDPLRELLAKGLPVWGTCAGAVLLAKHVPNFDRPPIAVMDITVERNAFGRQVDSFEIDIDITGIEGPPMRAIFIRAPIIRRAGRDVTVLASLEGGTIVAAREGRLLATSFHPELTDDRRMHGLFLQMVVEAQAPAGMPRARR
ncbi:MAG: pyridoxal 5'-phosphate synthase glutaminase subunit PdxT [Dehalococcoidia bacterium]|nr:pyridoxal 5'-phosphate synthase glutaminase subunit PdxT [Dehalococcoidia bacterium]